jgi:hypothetical protein
VGVRRTIVAEIVRVPQTHLQPVHASPARLVRCILSIEHLDHETLARILDALVEEGLDLLNGVRVATLGECKLPLYSLEVLSEQVSSTSEILLEQSL